MTYWSNIPTFRFTCKLSILSDVTKGLVFLHTRSPVVVHRDLTARNVLLDAAMTAKIADLGNSRITNLRPGQLAQTMTRGIPGTLVYMPPEASTDHYGPPLDMFSFGHLSLFAAIQVCHWCVWSMALYIRYVLIHSDILLTPAGH